MSYQICPICKGKGLIPATLFNQTAQKCDVCDGKKIIHEDTGSPPMGGVNIEAYSKIVKIPYVDYHNPHLEPDVFFTTSTNENHLIITTKNEE